MLTIAIACATGACVGLGLYFGDVFGYGWSSFFGVLSMIAVNAVAGYLVKKRIEAVMADVQGIMLAGKKKMPVAEFLKGFREPESWKAC